MPKKRKATKRNLAPASKVKRRADGRRATLVYIQPALLLSVKKAALDRQTTTFMLVEQAVAEWLERHRNDRL
jgi:hypothetical protein